MDRVVERTNIVGLAIVEAIDAGKVRPLRILMIVLIHCMFRFRLITLKIP